jgi:hypothetical protein
MSDQGAHHRIETGTRLQEDMLCGIMDAYRARLVQGLPTDAIHTLR